MRKTQMIIFAIFLIIGLSITSFAQDSSGDPYPTKYYIRRFDSFASTSIEFENRALDNLSILLNVRPDLIGYIIVYAGCRACGGEAQARAMRMKKYLVEYRSIAWDRLIWKDGGHLPNPYVLLETQIRGAEPYDYGYPVPLSRKDVQILDCKAIDNRRKRRGKW